MDLALSLIHIYFSEEKLDETGIDIRVRNDDFEEALSHIETMIQHHV